MRARYIGAEGATDAFGHVFPHGQWEDIDHLGAHARERLAEHPHFDVEGYEPPEEADEPEAPHAAPKPRPVRKRRKAKAVKKARHAQPAGPAADRLRTNREARPF